MMYVLIKKDGKANDALIIERYDEMMAKWVGGKVLPKEARAISGIDQIIMDDEKWSFIHRIMSYQFDQTPHLDVYADFTKQESGQIIPSQIFMKEFCEKYPYVRVNDAAAYLTSLRLIKEDDEIALLKKAIHVTNEAILNMNWKPTLISC